MFVTRQFLLAEEWPYTSPEFNFEGKLDLGGEKNETLSTVAAPLSDLGRQYIFIST